MTELTQEELASQVEAELARLRVGDVLLHTVSALVSLAYRRLGETEHDLEQARLAIESLKALAPVLEGSVPDEVLRDVRQATADLQVAFAAAVSG